MNIVFWIILVMALFIIWVAFASVFKFVGSFWDKGVVNRVKKNIADLEEKTKEEGKENK